MLELIHTSETLAERIAPRHGAPVTSVEEALACVPHAYAPACPRLLAHRPPGVPGVGGGRSPLTQCA